MNLKLEKQSTKDYQDWVANGGSRVISFMRVDKKRKEIKSKKSHEGTRKNLNFDENNEHIESIQEVCGGAVLIPGTHTLDDEENSIESHIKEIMRALIKENKEDITFQGPPELKTLLTNYRCFSSLDVLMLFTLESENPDQVLSAISMQPTSISIDKFLKSTLKSLDGDRRDLASIGMQLIMPVLLIPRAENISEVEEHVVRHLKDVVTWIEKLYGIQIGAIKTINELSEWFSLYFYRNLWELGETKEIRDLHRSSLFGKKTH